jgi:hypothetical protein
MNVVKITDGLGNQMFQYAFARSLQIESGSAVYLDTRYINNEDLIIRKEDRFQIKKNGHRKYGLDNFKITLPVAGNGILKHWNYLVDGKSTYSFLWKYFDEDVTGVKTSPILPSYYKGYFFNLKYYKDIKPILQREFVLKQKLRLPDSIKYILENDNTVSIHVRRGDFLKLNRDISQKDYYPKALKMISEMINTPTFLVFSDDIEWVKNNLKIGERAIYISGMGFKDFEELAIMKHCKHNIIANSTFSYWAAYLNTNQNKIVICPKRWKTDIIPEEWIKV